MIRKITLLFLACLSVFAVQAQHICGTDLYRNQLMASDPNYASMQNADRVAWSNYMSSLMSGPVGSKVYITGGDSVYEIPVVVHVMHTGGSVGSNYNPTDAQIISMIAYLNQSFEASWSGYPVAGSGGTKVPIRFTLAKRSPSCVASNGINRVNTSTIVGLTNYVSNGVNNTGSSGVSDVALKAASYWPNSEYYNIWLVNKIDGVDGYPPILGPVNTGYAYMPPVGNPLIDGMVMLTSQFNPTAFGASTLPHEIGHSFGLYHTFQGSTNSVCVSGACNSSGDLICDTDPELSGGVSSCPAASAINPCTSVPYGTYGVQLNFMTYSNCTQRKFTPGQSIRMLYALRGLRGGLLTSLGATAPSAPTPTPCAIPTTHTAVNNSGPSKIIITRSLSIPQDTLMHVTSEGYSGDGNLAYIDNTCKHRVDLISGGTYRLRIYKGDYPLLTGTNRFKAYIDYNNDGDFTDPGETLLHVGTTGSGAFIDTAFIVPITNVVNCTPLRMRIVGEPSTTGFGNFNSCTVVAGQAEDYEVLIKGAGGTSSNVPGLATLTKPPQGGNPSCHNTMLKFRVNTSNTIVPVYYRWFKKNGTTLTAGPAGATDTIWQANTFLNFDSVWVKVAYAGLCGIDTTVSDTIVVYRVTSITPTVTIGQTYGTNPGCPDDSVGYSVIATINPGGSPTYSWYLNGSSTPVQIGSSIYLGMRGVASGTTIRVVMQSSAGAPCAPAPGTATSNTITYTHTTQVPTAQVALTGGTNPGCAGQTLTFSAITTFAGTSPTYQWKVNGVNSGTNSPTFSGVFNNGDVITYTLTSNSTCVLLADRVKNSNSITVVHAQIHANITIAVVGGSTACQGHPVLFSANTTNAGSNPGFEWRINGVTVPNSNSPIFQTTSLNNGDKVSCVLQATDPCVDNPLDTSLEISMTITISSLPAVSIAITAGKNPWCLDSLVEFSATASNAGADPNFEWLVNGFPSFNGPVFANDAYLNGDMVVCRLNTTDGKCYLPDTVYSSSVTMIRSTLPDPPIIHLVNNMLITNKAGTYKWWGPQGLYSTGTNGIFHPSEKGLYMAVTDNNGCWSLASNLLTITLLDINMVELPAVNIYPNPTNGQLILDWGTINVNMTIGIYNTLGQQIMNDEVKNESRKVMDLSRLTPGIYYIAMKDDNGNSGTVKITVSK